MGGVGRTVSRIFGGGGGGGGGGGNITYNVPQPAAPAPIDYDRMYAAATRSAIDTMREEEAQLQRLYPTMANLQFSTVDRLAGGLDNQYLGTARNVIGDELNAASRSSALEDAIQRRSADQFASGPTLADRQILGQSMMAMGQRADQVASQDVGAGSLGGALMAQAMERAQSGGRLSAEASRDATQAARAGMAARGLATGSAGVATELLNRDRFARARQAEDNAFASAVQGQDLTRQFNNQESRMRAALANQQANQQQLAQNRSFMMAGRDAFNAAEDRRMNMALGANQLDLARRQRRLGLAGGYADLDPYARATGPAFQVGSANTGQGLQAIGQTFGNALQASGNVASFNTNMQAGLYNSWQNNNAAVQAANAQAAASRRAGGMGLIGNILGGGIAAAGLAFSDKRMKKDIKPLGKAGSVLGLTAYEFSYKGEKKKRKGFMAQDVAKVLPEAVEEVDYKGKKRLAIKPAVIGAALAEELMAAKAA
jgi:hypothetical protein